MPPVLYDGQKETWTSMIQAIMETWEDILSIEKLSGLILSNSKIVENLGFQFQEAEGLLTKKYIKSIVVETQLAKILTMLILEIMQNNE